MRLVAGTIDCSDWVHMATVVSGRGFLEKRTEEKDLSNGNHDDNDGLDYGSIGDTVI